MEIKVSKRYCCHSCNYSSSTLFLNNPCGSPLKDYFLAFWNTDWTSSDYTGLYGSEISWLHDFMFTVMVMIHFQPKFFWMLSVHVVTVFTKLTYWALKIANLISDFRRTCILKPLIVERNWPKFGLWDKYSVYGILLTVKCSSSYWYHSVYIWFWWPCILKTAGHRVKQT